MYTKRNTYTFHEFNDKYELYQRLSNCGPRTKGSPRRVQRGLRRRSENIHQHRLVLPITDCVFKIHVHFKFTLCAYNSDYRPGDLHCVSKMHQLRNGIAQNCNDRFIFGKNTQRTAE